jgi:hypothetical protein
VLNEEHQLRVLENRVLRGIFGPKRKEVIRVWRKIHNDECHNLYTSPNVVRVIKTGRMRWVGNVARKGETRNAYKVLVRNSEEKRPFGRPGLRWEDNIKIYFTKLGLEMLI